MENDREPMDSLTDGTASLLRYDDRRRQLDLLCMILVGKVCWCQTILTAMNSDCMQFGTEYFRDV